MRGIEAEEKEKFEELRKRLGLEYPIESLLTAQPHTKEHHYSLLHQEADTRCRTMANYNEELVRKVKNQNKELESQEAELEQFNQKCKNQIASVDFKLKTLQADYNDMRAKIKDSVRNEQAEVSNELGRMLQHGHVLMGEKANLIHEIKDELVRSSEHHTKVSEMREMGKREAEF